MVAITTAVDRMELDIQWRQYINVLENTGSREKCRINRLKFIKLINLCLPSQITHMVVLNRRNLFKADITKYLIITRILLILLVKRYKFIHFYQRNNKINNPETFQLTKRYTYVRFIFHTEICIQHEKHM